MAQIKKMIHLETKECETFYPLKFLHYGLSLGPRKGKQNSKELIREYLGWLTEV